MSLYSQKKKYLPKLSTPKSSYFLKGYKQQSQPPTLKTFNLEYLLPSVRHSLQHHKNTLAARKPAGVVILKIYSIILAFLVHGSTRKYTKTLHFSLVGFINKFHILQEDENGI